MEIITLGETYRKEENAKLRGRYNFLFGMIGTNRTGKSITAQSIGKLWRNSNPDDTIVSFDPQKRFSDISDWNIQPDDDEWCVKLHTLRNALVILDDFRLINEKNTPIKGLSKLLYFRAEWNIDIIYIVHNPSLIINLLTYYTTNYFLFYTEATDGQFQKKIANYNLCINGQRLINNYVRAYGRGTYPDFPHIIVDCENRELNAVNFKKVTDNKKINKIANANKLLK